MKKILSLVLVLCMTFAMAACGNEDSVSTDVPTESAAEQTLPSEETAASSEPATKPKPAAETLPDFQKDAVMEETVLYDENDLKITATGLSYDDYSVNLELLLENNSETDRSFFCETYGYSCNSVNGFLIEDGYLSCDVPAGKKANEKARFSYDNLQLFGIQEIADIELGFEIRDEENNSLHTGPRQIRTSAFESYDYSTDRYQQTIASAAAQNTFRYEMPCFTTDVVYEKNGVRAVSAGMIVNRDGEQAILLELENTSEEPVFLEASDVIINGLAAYDYSCGNLFITPGRRGVLNINLDFILEPELRDPFGISQISSVTFSLRQNDDDWHNPNMLVPVTVPVSDADISFDSTGTEVYNQNGLRILSKVILEDSSELDDDLHVLLLAENTGDTALRIDAVYDSLSVNGFMTDYYFDGKRVESGQSGILDIKLRADSLEKNKISSPEDITGLEIGIQIKPDSGNDEEITLNIAY